MRVAGELARRVRWAHGGQDRAKTKSCVALSSAPAAAAIFAHALLMVPSAGARGLSLLIGTVRILLLHFLLLLLVFRWLLAVLG
jgi:hypothetical protein